MKFNKLIPELSVSDIEKSKNFYINILGFTLQYERKESKFAFLSFQESQIMIEEINDTWKTAELEKPFGRGINFQIEVDDTERLIKSLEKNNYPIKYPLKENQYEVNDKLYCQKEFIVMDPDGYLLRFAQNLGIKKK